MGYETAHSKRLRGDLRSASNSWFATRRCTESEKVPADIIRPFVAREGLDMHLGLVGLLFDERTTGVHRLIELQRLLRFYVPWYLNQWRGGRLPVHPEFHHSDVRSKLIFVELVRVGDSHDDFYSMLFRRQALRDDQGRQNRIEMIGEDLLVIATTALYAEAQDRPQPIRRFGELVEECFREAQQRIEQDIKGLIRNQDTVVAAVGKDPSAVGILRLPMESSVAIFGTTHDRKVLLKPGDVNMHTVV